MGGALLARLRTLTGNRWAMAGVAGAAGLGAVALARSRGGGTAPSTALGAGSGATADAGEVAGAAFTGQAFPDTYATDLASAVGDLDSKWAGELADYTAEATANATSLDALTKANAKQQTSIDAVTKKVAALNPAPAPKVTKAKATAKPKASTTTTPSGWRTITIRSGDTLGAIASRYHTSVSTLSKRNKITDPNRIRAGAKLQVPT